MSEYLRFPIHLRFPIEGMTCTPCASRIARAVRKLDGVESVRVCLGSDSGDFAFDPARTSLEAIAQVIRRGGYEAQIEHAEPFTPAERRNLRARLGLGR
jgi:copper chaperone CopZ